MGHLLGGDGTDQALAYRACRRPYLYRLLFPRAPLEDFSSPGSPPGVVVAVGAAYPDRFYRAGAAGPARGIHPPLSDRPAAESAGFFPGGRLGGGADLRYWRVCRAHGIRHISAEFETVTPAPRVLQPISRWRPSLFCHGDRPGAGRGGGQPQRKRRSRLGGTSFLPLGIEVEPPHRTEDSRIWPGPE